MLRISASTRLKVFSLLKVTQKTLDTILYLATNIPRNGRQLIYFPKL